MALERKIGDGMIATGWLMGFGVGDFTADHLSAKLVNDVTNTTEVALSPAERVYISCALVLRRPIRAAR